MSATDLFKSFSGPQSKTATVFLARGKLDEIRRTAQEAGYKRGFQEASEKAAASKMAALENITATLEEHAYSKAEAHHAVLKTLQPLVEQMVESVLPEVARVGISDLISRQLTKIAAPLADDPIILRCPETYRRTLEDLVGDMNPEAANVVVISDSNLGALEIRLSSSNSELHIDVADAIERIRDSVSDFYNSLEKKTA